MVGRLALVFLAGAVAGSLAAAYLVGWLLSSTPSTAAHTR